MILARRERMGEAITAYQNAIRVDPTHGPAYLRLAEALDRIGRPGEAWTAAEQAHDRGEDVAPAFWQQLTGKLPTAPPLPPLCADVSGAPVDLDNPDPAHRGYIAGVRERIRGHLMYPRGAGERRIAGELQVEFRIGRAGAIACVALRRASGSELLDRYVLSALRLAQPFAALPSHVPGAALPVSGTFRFRISEAAASR
jgi:TonB family protein